MGNINKTVKSKYPPKQKNVNWIDTSGNKPVIKVFNNGKWQKLSGGGAGSTNSTEADVNKVWQVTPVLKGTKTKETILAPQQIMNIVDNEESHVIQNVTNIDKFVEGNEVIAILDGNEYHGIIESRAELDDIELLMVVFNNEYAIVKYPSEITKLSEDILLFGVDEPGEYEISLSIKSETPIYDYNWAPGVKIPIPTSEDEGKILVVTKVEGDNSSIIVPEQSVPADTNTPLTGVDLTKFVVGNNVKVTITPEENDDDDTPVPGHLPDYSGPVSESGPAAESEQGGSSEQGDSPGTSIPIHKPAISQTVTLTGVIEENGNEIFVYFANDGSNFNVCQTGNSLYTDVIVRSGPDSTIKLEYIESNYEYQLQENSGGNNSIVSVDINDMPNTLSPNIIYDFGELDQDIEFPEFESTEGYGTYTILFDTADDIEIGFNSEVIWQSDSPDGTEGNHIEICIHSIGDKYYGYYIEYQLPVPNYLTFTAVEDNSSVGFWYWIGPASGTCPDLGKNMEYSLDNGKTWETYTIVNVYNNMNWINLEHVGDSVMFRGNNETLVGTEDRQYTGCLLQGKVAASGDITSLLNGKGGDIPVPDRCFYNFFFMSDALTSAPNLPSKTLGKDCYGYMFNMCSNLSSVTCLATDISAGNCTSSWLYGVSQTGTFTKAAGMNDWTTGDSGIPEGWTVESL